MPRVHPEATLQQQLSLTKMSQISASFVSATNQNSVGLANFNIEFSLVKIAAPEEYQGLGTLLSQRRRENAEEGPLHRTARKLGLLFEHLVPPISDLIKSYGIRVSEIASQSNVNLKVGKTACLTSISSELIKNLG
jgi:hypothetical protein